MKRYRVEIEHGLADLYFDFVDFMSAANFMGAALESVVNREKMTVKLSIVDKEVGLDE